MLSVDWSSESETSELPVLLDLWKVCRDVRVDNRHDMLFFSFQQKAPIDVADALKLLSGGEAFRSPLVRQYAVDVLRNASDDELRILLLQLVQALRYEPAVDVGDIANIQSKNDCANIAVIDWDKHYSFLSPLGRFLIDRACSSSTCKCEIKSI